MPISHFYWQYTHWIYIYIYIYLLYIHITYDSLDLSVYIYIYILYIYIYILLSPGMAFAANLGWYNRGLLRGAPPGHHVDVPIADSLAFGFREAAKSRKSRDHGTAFFMHKKYES